MLKDHHVTYREIGTTYGISGTSIRVHSILHEHLTVKKIFGVGSHTVCQMLKKSSCRSKKILKKFNRGALKRL